MVPLDVATCHKLSETRREVDKGRECGWRLRWYHSSNLLCHCSWVVWEWPLFQHSRKQTNLQDGHRFGLRFRATWSVSPPFACADDACDGCADEPQRRQAGPGQPVRRATGVRCRPGKERPWGSPPRPLWWWLVGVGSASQTQKAMGTDPPPSLQSHHCRRGGPDPVE